VESVVLGDSNQSVLIPHVVLPDWAYAALPELKPSQPEWHRYIGGSYLQSFLLKHDRGLPTLIEMIMLEDSGRTERGLKIREFLSWGLLGVRSAYERLQDPMMMHTALVVHDAARAQTR